MTASQRALAHIHAAAAEAGIGSTSKETHAILHEWAIYKSCNGLKDMDDADLDGVAQWIKAEPEMATAYFEGFIPEPWERMADAENAEPSDPSVLAHLFSSEQLADLNADADRIQRIEGFRQ